MPVRHGRMMVSPFTFYRGAAKIMAADLKGTPNAGLDRAALWRCAPVELRRVRVARAAAAVRRQRLRRDAAGAVRVRREADGRELHDRCAQQRLHQGRRAGGHARIRHRVPGGDGRLRRRCARWRSGTRTCPRTRSWRRYARPRRPTSKEAKRAEKIVEKARTRDSLQALSKLGELRRREVPDREPAADRRPRARPGGQLRPVPGGRGERRSASSSAPTGPPSRTTGATCSSGSEFVDLARKVVGVGSVGTRAFIVLLQGRDEQDPLFLQVKEATSSVLEDHLPKSRYKHHGERVVRGQRMMQAASDIYLGWTVGFDATRHFYWRQLRDMKGSADWSRRCRRRRSRPTRTSAHGPSRERTPAPGTRSRSPRTWARATSSTASITDFSERYADQNERDYEAFIGAIRSGKLQATEGV